MATPRDQAVVEQILRGTREAGKTHGFDSTHDPQVPAQTWFQESAEGLVLFVVFYTQACRWSRCLGCNLPSRVSRDPVALRALVAQIDHLFEIPEIQARRTEIRKLIVSNNGSVLDQQTFSSTALMYLMARVNLNLPGLTTLALETRPEYVEVAELEFLSRALAEGETPTGLELAIGFEAFDERIRNQVFDKGLTLAAFEGLVRRIAPYGFHLKCYFMLKPVPGMGDTEAVDDIRQAIDYLSATAQAHGVTINLHLNPTFVASGTRLEEAFLRGEYRPPSLRDVAEAARHARGKQVSVFLGLYDEGLAVPGGTFLGPEEEALVSELERFNRTQDHDILDALVAGGP